MRETARRKSRPRMPAAGQAIETMLGSAQRRAQHHLLGEGDGDGERRPAWMRVCGISSRKLPSPLAPRAGLFLRFARYLAICLKLQDGPLFLTRGHQREAILLAALPGRAEAILRFRGERLQNCAVRDRAYTASATRPVTSPWLCA